MFAELNNRLSHQGFYVTPEAVQTAVQFLSKGRNPVYTTQWIKQGLGEGNPVSL